MTPPWADADPLPGCEVVRPVAPAAPPAPTDEPPKRAGRTHPLAAKVSLANRFLDRVARTLHPTTALVWMLLWRDEREGKAQTAVSDLARRSGRSERTVKRALKELRVRGLLGTVAGGNETVGPTVHRLPAGRSGPPKAGVTNGP